LVFSKWQKNQYDKIVPAADSELCELLKWKPWDSDERQHFDNDGLRKRVLECPQGVAVRYEFEAPGRGNRKRYPFFRAISLGATLDVLKIMYDIYPPAIKDAGTNGSFRSTPLHAACAYRAPLEVVKLLIREYPEAAAIKTNHGYTPLHNACEYGVSSPDVIKLLIQTNPQALEQRNKLGNTPFLTALKSPHTDPAVLKILKLSHIINDHRARMHVACRWPHHR
jgi:hypothetical protein